jgi:hypothetical protein
MKVWGLELNYLGAGQSDFQILFHPSSLILSDSSPAWHEFAAQDEPAAKL